MNLSQRAKDYSESLPLIFIPRPLQAEHPKAKYLVPVLCAARKRNFFFGGEHFTLGEGYDLILIIDCINSR